MGPEKPTLNPQDIFPSLNGFYVKPKAINIQAFMMQQYEVRLAKIRQVILPVSLVVARDIPANEKKNRTAEADEESDLDLGKTENSYTLLNNNQIRRWKRNLYEDLYENVNKNVVNFPIRFQSANSTGLHFTVNVSENINLKKKLH